MRWLVALFALICWTAAAEEADLELVLAVDASGSVNAAEFALQLGGLAAGFRDGRVKSAIQSGPRGRIAVALMIWSDAAYPRPRTDWFILDSDASADRFATLLESQIARRNETDEGYRGGTGIGAALVDAVSMITGNGIASPRQIIDVSGDGAESPPRTKGLPMVSTGRNVADAAGININGLAVLTDDRLLDSYYRRWLITGPGAFVLTADGFEDFEAAMKIKLLREIQVLIGDSGVVADGPS